jgi:hypothetical protein
MNIVDNSYGLVVLLVATLVVVLAFLWNRMVPNSMRVSFDIAERIFIYIMLFASVVAALYIHLTGD